MHTSYCDNKSWGPAGPCCRCEGALKFFLDMQVATEYNSTVCLSKYSNLCPEKGVIYTFDANMEQVDYTVLDEQEPRAYNHHKKKKFPQWLTFSDDDYYVKTCIILFFSPYISSILVY